MKSKSHGKSARIAIAVAASVLATAALSSRVEGAAPAADSTQDSREIAFSIPAQSLTSALTAFAEASGLRFAYDASLTRGAESPGLRGRMSATAALRALLSGTGLTYRFTGNKTITLEKAPSGTRTLGPVRVEGADSARVSGINGSADVTATEGTGSYTSGALSIGSKTAQSIKETPQSVSVLTATRIEDQGITDFTQALNQMPGVSLVTGGSTGTQSNLESAFYSRGFMITSMQVDGGAAFRIAGDANVAYFPQIDLAQFDHVEILRGPAGLFNGYGDPSGTVNLVRKKPLDHAQVTWEGQAGSWSNYRAVLDATAPLALDGRLRGRLVMTYQDNEYFYDLARDKKTVIYGVVDHDLTTSTLLTGGISFARQDSVPWVRGLPRYQNGDDLGLPRSASFVLPWNQFDLDTLEVFANVEQKLGDDWTAKFTLTQNQQDSTRKIGYATNAVNPLTGVGPVLYGNLNDYSSKLRSTELTLAGHFEVLGQRQDVVFGVNQGKSDGGAYYNYSALIAGTPAAPYQPYAGGPLFCIGTAAACPNGANPPIDVRAFDPYDPLYNEPRQPLAETYFHDSGDTQSGAYVNLRLTAFDRLHLTTGVRYSRYKNIRAAEGICASIPAVPPTPTNCAGRQIGDVYRSTLNTYKSSDFTWPPTVSLSYDVTRDISTYLTYADIYVSQASMLDPDFEPLDPIKGKNVELGVKWAGADGRLNGTLAGYRIDQSGIGAEIGTVFGVDTKGTRCCYSVSDGHVLSKGVDAELTGQLLPAWQIFTGYTYNKNEKTGSYYGTSDGKRNVTRQPQHLLKLWSTYDLGKGGAGAYDWLAPLSISLGLNWQSKAYAAGTACTQLNPPDSRGVSACAAGANIPYSYTQDSYGVLSARLAYGLSQNWAVALNADNITDERYYQTMGSSSAGNWYGKPSSYTLTLRGTF